MISFSAAAPFPLLPQGTYSEREARLHAAAVDEWLGLQTNLVEHSLAQKGCRLRAPDSSHEKQELWFGLDVQLLLTPYLEIRAWLEQLRPQPGQTIVDLGAAYGRMGFVLARHFPEVRFIGYEYVGERVAEGRRCLRKHFPGGLAKLEHADLASPEFEPSAADFYFLYDYGTPKAIEKTLHDLRRSSKERPITIIARGRHSRYMIESRHTWLKKSAGLVEGEARSSLFRSAS